MELWNKRYLLIAIPALGLAITPVLAEDEDSDPDDDITMAVVEEGELPDAVFEQIELPEEAAAIAVERSERGLDTANTAREDGRAFGQAMAEEARERANGADEAAEDARSDARDRMASDVAGGNFENLPEQARENIPQDVQDRVRDARDRRRGPPEGVGGGGG